MLHSPPRRTSDSELSDLSDAESRPGSVAAAASTCPDSEAGMSLRAESSDSDHAFSAPALDNPLYAGSPARLSEAAEEPALPQAAPAAAFEHMLAQQRGAEQLDAGTSTASSVSLASFYAAAEGPPNIGAPNPEHDRPSNALPRQRHAAAEPAVAASTHDVQSFAGFQSANPLYGAGSSMAMFQSVEWGHTMQQHQLGDSFRPVPHETNPLFARW